MGNVQGVAGDRRTEGQKEMLGWEMARLAGLLLGQRLALTEGQWRQGCSLQLATQQLQRVHYPSAAAATAAVAPLAQRQAYAASAAHQHSPAQTAAAVGSTEGSEAH